jgi:insulysin
MPDDLRASLEKASKVVAGERLKDLYMPYKNKFIPPRLGVEKTTVTQPAKASMLIRNDPHIRT